MKKHLKKILNLKPKCYICIYFLLIPLFALFYWAMPLSNFETELLIDNFLVCLYFSTVTITTLGFGDITPISPLLQIVTIFESIMGLVTIGLFFNSVAHLKSKIDVDEEKAKNKERIYLQEKIKLKRYNKFVQNNIEFYVLYTSIVTTPMQNRNKHNLNREFVFNDLKIYLNQHY